MQKPPKIIPVIKPREVIFKTKERTRFDPNIILDVIFRNGLLFLAVQNIGPQSAHHISVHFDETITGLPAEDKPAISDLPLFKNIGFMPPDKHIETFVDRSSSYFKRGEPTQITARVAFKNENGDYFRNVITHNLEIYRDIGFVTLNGQPVSGKK